MGFTGETDFRDLFKTWLHFDEMLSRQNWGKFKEFHRTWPMIFNYIFSLLPLSHTLCCSQMLWGWQGFIVAGDKNHSMPNCEISFTCEEQRGPDLLSKFVWHPSCWGLCTFQPSLRAQWLPRHIFVLWITKNLERQRGNFSQEQKNWSGEETSGIISKCFPNIHHSHQEPALSSTTFSSVSFTSLSVYSNLYF